MESYHILSPFLYIRCVNTKLIKSWTWHILTKLQLSTNPPIGPLDHHICKRALDQKVAWIHSPNFKSEKYRICILDMISSTFTEQISAKESEREKIETPSEPALSNYRLLCALCIDKTWTINLSLPLQRDSLKISETIVESNLNHLLEGSVPRNHVLNFHEKVW